MMTTASHTEHGLQADCAPPPSGEGRIISGAQPARWKRLAITWQAAINYFVPIGYEDHDGFHYGEKPAPNAPVNRVENAAEIG